MVLRNESKKEALELALNTLNISDFVIECLEVPSHVSLRPINGEAVLGAHNRNQEILDYCLKNQVSYDLLISIEDGYE